MRPPRRSNALIWYPKIWRARHGEELRSLIEDFAAEGDFRLRDRIELMRLGLALRWRRHNAGRAHHPNRVPALAMRAAGAVAAVVVALTVTLGAWHSQPTNSGQGSTAIRDRAAVAVDVGALAATAAMTIRRTR
jgi:hypothetical protein